MSETVTSVRLDARRAAKLAELARLTERSRSGVMRMLVDQAWARELPDVRLGEVHKQTNLERSAEVSKA